jgi:HAD superfamily hydrolase (TIGR01509 family)
MLKAVIFDVDGTLVDTVDLHAHAWQDAFAKWGKDVPYIEVRKQIGKGGDQILPMFFTREEIDGFGKELSEWRGEHFKRKYLSQAKAFPHTRELFEVLRERSVKIALASSAKKDELEGYKKLARISDLTDAETNADDVEKTKPHPDVFEIAAKKLDVKPDEAIAVGDSPFDAEAAGKIGIRTIGVLCGGFPEEVLRAAGATEIYRDPEDLLTHLSDITGLKKTPKEERNYGESKPEHSKQRQDRQRAV